MVYKPVVIVGRQLSDGGIRSTTNVDIAVERGAKFIVVVNPLVPYVNDFQTQIPTAFGTKVRRVADMGFAQIGYQTFKLVCAKHGIEISATRVRKVVGKFSREREKTAAWRRILEQTTGALLRQSEDG